MYEPTDPEPEYVTVNSLGQVAVTIQENNAIAIVDIVSGAVLSSFSPHGQRGRPRLRQPGMVDRSSTPRPAPSSGTPERTLAALTADPDVPEHVEELMWRDWRHHIGPIEGIADVAEAARQYAKAGARLTKTAVGISRQTAPERWQDAERRALAGHAE